MYLWTESTLEMESVVPHRSVVNFDLLAVPSAIGSCRIDWVARDRRGSTGAGGLVSLVLGLQQIDELLVRRTQTQADTDTGMHRQAATDTGMHRQAAADTGKHSHTSHGCPGPQTWADRQADGAVLRMKLCPLLTLWCRPHSSVSLLGLLCYVLHTCSAED